MRRPRIFYGWWIVAAAVGITLVGSTFFEYGFSSFFIPWHDSFGWSRSVLGGVLGLSRLVGGLLAPVFGWLIDKYGPRRMAFLGLGILGLGFIALSFVNSLVMLYVVYLSLMSIGFSLGVFRPAQVAVANWFVRFRGRAMGIVITGPALGGSAIFLFALFINNFGWRAGAVLAGVSLWAVGFPLSTLLRHKPEQMGLLPDGFQVPPGIGVSSPAAEEGSPAIKREPSAGQEGETSGFHQHSKPHRIWMRDPRPEIDLTIWQALRSQAFWLMAITYAMWGSTLSVILVHMAPFLAEELELEFVVAVSALSFFAFTSIFGRLGFGFLADYVNVRLVTVLLLVIQALGMFLFSNVHTLAQIPIYVTIFALPFGGMLPLRSVLQGYFFGRKAFGTIEGFMQLVNLPVSVTAPIWMGWLADELPDGYRIGFQILAASLVVAALCILLSRRPRPPLPADRPPVLFRASAVGR